jgi:hypothetical protein
MTTHNAGRRAGGKPGTHTWIPFGHDAEVVLA